MKLITMKMRRRIQPSGFTIVELLIATVVFSVILVMILAAFVQISRVFYKGINMSNTQDDTRTALNDIASDIQFYSGTPLTYQFTSNPVSSGSFCVGNHRYTYYTGAQVGSGLAGIYRENLAGCPPLSLVGVTPASADQILGAGMQLNSLGINCSGAICQLSAHVVFYGGDPAGLFTSHFSSTLYSVWQEPDAECTGALTSSQYCATADYSSTVLQKV